MSWGDLGMRTLLCLGASFFAVADIQYTDMEKLGFAGLTFGLFFWVTNKLSKQLDEQTSHIEYMTQKIVDLIEKTSESLGRRQGDKSNG